MKQNVKRIKETDRNEKNWSEAKEHGKKKKELKEHGKDMKNIGTKRERNEHARHELNRKRNDKYMKRNEEIKTQKRK